MKHHIFSVFLVVYVLLLGYHLFSLGISPILFAGIGTGLLLAYVAHKDSHGKIALYFLTIHMAIEWWYYGMEGFHFERDELLFHGLHVIMDGIFLYQEARFHFTKRWKSIISGIALFLAVITVISWGITPHDVISSHKELSPSISLLKTVVMAGMIGCILSILFSKDSHKKHSHA